MTSCFNPRPLGFLAGLLLTLPLAAQQPAWPSKAIRIVAPASAGSGTDLMARLVGQPMQAALGQPVLVENRVGGGGSVGMAAVASAPPDGYALLLSTDATIAIQPHFRKEPFDPVKDLAPIGEIASFALVVVVRADSTIASLKDLAQVARATPGGVAYGVGGKATGGHITGETIRRALDIPLTAVAYPSAARAVTDLLGGHVDVAISDSVSIVPYVKSGKLKAIATAAAARARCLPDTLTLQEQGVSFDLPYSYGLLAPPGTPPDIVDRLNKELRAALALPAVRDRIIADCQEPAIAANSPSDFAERVRYHWTRWGKLIRDAGVQVE